MSFYSGNNEALLHDSLTEHNQEKEYSKYLGKTSSANQIALAFASVSGAFIAYWSFAWVMWLSVIPAVLGLFVSFKLSEPKIHDPESGNIYSHLKTALLEFKKNKKLRMISLSSIIGFAQGEASYQFRSAFIATLWPIWAIGIARLLSNAGAAASFYYSGKLIERFGEYKIMIIGKLYALVSDVLSVAFPNIASPAILSSNSLFHGVQVVASSTLKQREFTYHQRSTMGSLISFFRNLAFAVVAYFLGIMADNFGTAKAYLYIKVLAVISLWIYWKLFRKAKKN